MGGAMLKINGSSWCSRLCVGLLLATFLSSFIGIGGSSLGAAPAFAQDATPSEAVVAEPTAEATEAVAPPITESPPLETVPPDSEETATVVPPVVETQQPGPSDGEENTNAPDEASQNETPTPTAHLGIDPVPVVTCAIEGHTTRIEHGSWQLYACDALIDISGENLPTLDAQLTLTVQAATSGDWLVRLAPRSDKPDWTTMETSLAVLDIPAPFVRESDEPDWQTNASIGFLMQVFRARCDVASQFVEVEAAVSVAASGPSDPVVTPAGIGRDPLRIVPEIAPIPVPLASFDGPIAFNPLQVNAVDNATADGSARIAVIGLNRACGDWILTLQASSGSTYASLWLSSINGVPLDEACALSDECAVGLMTGNETRPGNESVTLGLQITIAGGVPPGALSVSFDIALVAA
jgi:hypothetical protein